MVAAAAAFLSMIICTAVLPACSSGGAGGEAREHTSFVSSEEGVRMLAGDWVVEELDGKPIGEQMHDSAARRPMMTIKPDGSVGGFSGVNQFGSELRAGDLARGRFTLGPIAMTRMAGPPQMMSIEAKLTTALSEPRRFSLRETVLVLMPAEGRADPLVAFRRELGSSAK